MKKLRILFSLLVVFCLVLVGCNQKNTTNKSEDKNSKKVIYTTFYPVTELTNMIVGDKMEVKSIIKGGQEPHSFELKIQDMKEISKADLIVYNGANMEEFIPELEKVVNNNEKFLNLSQGLVLLESEHGVEEENHKHGHDEKITENVNPHTWLSVKNIMIELDTIYKKIVSIDKENENYYKDNFEKAVKSFRDLDNKFKEELSKVKSKDKYFVVSHAAFNYLAGDYGLKQVAVTGISPEDEPSAKQLKVIADFVKDKNIKTIFFEGKATPKVAETLAKNTNTKTATLHTLENLTEEEVKLGYIKLMEQNLEALVKSFNE